MKRCFVIGPMGKKAQRLERLAQEVVAPILQPLGYEVSTPELMEIGRIMANVVRDLDHADVVVANLTDWNPNVMYEVGIRHSLGRPTILVTEDTDVPYDLKSERFFSIRLEKRDIERSREKLRDVLLGADKQVESMVHPVNPVIEYFTAALTEVSPAPGLALGYFRNFVRLTVSCLQTIDPATGTYRYALQTQEGLALPEGVRAGAKVSIIRPNDLSELRDEQVTAYRAKNQLVQVMLGTHRRPMAIYVKPGWETEGLTVVDLPTTANVIEEAIEMRLGGRHLADPTSEEWKAIERDEMIRFYSVLQRLIRSDRETPRIQDMVEVERIKPREDAS
ncbi:MAG: STING domain-containing protein [Verrucomicrobiota bacterium]